MEQGESLFTESPSPFLTNDPNISTLTDSQESLMSILALISGCLSLTGSSLIVYRIFKNRHQGTTSYDRIMLGLSLCDIVASISFSFAPIMLPQETSTRAWASGTDRSCSVLGFLTQFGFSAVWYNALLSFYYLMTVRFGVKKHLFAKKYEPYMHFVSIAFFVATSVSGLFIDLYGELEITQGCWIGEYPENCEADDTCKGTLIGWIFGGLPVLVTFFALPINNIAIFMYVRRNLSRATAGGSASEEQWIRIREVAIQGLLYVGCFYISYTPAFVIRAMEGAGLNGEKESDIFPVLLMNSFLLPLQGFFNVFIYARPNFVRVRTAYPEQTKFWAVRTALLESDIPSLSESRNLFSSQGSAGGKGSNSALAGTQAANNYNNGRRSRSRSRKLSSNLDVVMEGSEEDSSSAADASSKFQTYKQRSRRGLFEDDDPPSELEDSASSLKDSSFPTQSSDLYSTSEGNSLRINMDGSLK